MHWPLLKMTAYEKCDPIDQCIIQLMKQWQTECTTRKVLCYRTSSPG